MPKTVLSDLGRANIDSYVVIKQMKINDSKNASLMKTDNSRASLKDIGGLRGKDYLGSYLERVTSDVKIPQRHVQPLQVGIEPQVGSKATQPSTLGKSSTSPLRQVAASTGMILNNGQESQILP